MNFINEQHKARFEEALGLSGAVREGGNISAYFGASLFLLSGLEWLYPRVKAFINRDYIDFEEMLGDSLALSKGERMAVSLASNLYNGRGFKEYTPIDLVSDLDEEYFGLCVQAIILRKSRLNISSFAA